ncbi:MAG: type II toxin-antitoxin system HicA family toxin, partial [Candidatus ainarchaeum sp.]|nr:type II toxin-antitoxin system HicA family toxin [Candidatus ainarchaeum sp.]
HKQRGDMKLPRITGAKMVGALRKAGFEEVGTRGSHHYLYHAQRDVIVTVPVHSDYQRVMR